MLVQFSETAETKTEIAEISRQFIRNTLISKGENEENVKGFLTLFEPGFDGDMNLKYTVEKFQKLDYFDYNKYKQNIQNNSVNSTGRDNYNSEDLLKVINKKFSQFQDRNENYVEYVKTHNFDSKIYEQKYYAVDDALLHLNDEFNDTSIAEKNFELLLKNGVFEDINNEILSKSDELRSLIYHKLLMLYVRRHLDDRFDDNKKMNAKFAEYVANSELMTDKKQFYLNQPKSFSIFKQDPLITKFIEQNKEEQVKDVLHLDREKLEMFKQDEIWERFDANMMFNRTYLKMMYENVSVKFNFKRNIRERFPSANDSLLNFLFSFLSKKGDNILENYSIKSKFRSLNLDNDENLAEFLKKSKVNYIKSVLQELYNKAYEDNLNILQYGNIAIDVSIDMLFDRELMKNYLKSRLELINFMNSKFPDAKDLNSRFVDFLVKSNATLNKYKLSSYDLNKEALMKKFISENSKDRLKQILREMNSQQHLNQFDSRNISLKFDVNIMFNPDIMKIFLKNEYSEACRSAFTEILDTKIESWGRTPDKCIINLVCNNTQEFWSSGNVAKEISKYPVVERTFDEVDEMFFDLISNDVKSDPTYFKNDADCLIAFIKRTNVRENWYRIELITDDGMRKKQLEKINTAYDKSVGVNHGTKAQLPQGRNPHHTTRSRKY